LNFAVFRLDPAERDSIYRSVGWKFSMIYEGIRICDLQSGYLLISDVFMSNLFLMIANQTGREAKFEFMGDFDLFEWVKNMLRIVEEV
jgi:hypothetical protein